MHFILYELSNEHLISVGIFVLLNVPTSCKKFRISTNYVRSVIGTFIIASCTPIQYFCALFTCTYILTYLHNTRVYEGALSVYCYVHLNRYYVIHFCIE